MNPIAILVIGIIWLGSLIGVGKWQHAAGVDHQKVADQVQFDKINQETADQKTKAAGLLAKANADNLALMTERDTLKTNLEIQHAKDTKASDDLRRQYAGYRLRFQSTQATGPGIGCGGTVSAAASAAGANASASIELPAEINRRLFDIADDANKLADAYRECYGYAQQVR